jgi:SAM-dependent methyltransferase
VEPKPSFDPAIPSIARTYDFVLGGKDHYPSDRKVGEIFIQRFPGAVQIALDNRACLIRAVAVMANELGIDQFIDLGSGLPTVDNVHQVAQRHNDRAVVVYVDNDPVVLAHGRALLEENSITTVLQADIRHPEQILASPEVCAMIDLSRPIGVVASAVLHHIHDDEDPSGIVGAFRDAMAAGSCLFISHFRTPRDPASAAMEMEMERVMLEAFGRGEFRTDEQIAAYFQGLHLVEPGIVPCAQWRADGQDDGSLTDYQRLIVAGLGRK